MDLTTHSLPVSLNLLKDDRKRLSAALLSLSHGEGVFDAACLRVTVSLCTCPALFHEKKHDPTNRNAGAWPSQNRCSATVSCFVMGSLACHSGTNAETRLPFVPGTFPLVCCYSPLTMSLSFFFQHLQWASQLPSFSESQRGVAKPGQESLLSRFVFVSDFTCLYESV